MRPCGRAVGAVDRRCASSRRGWQRECRRKCAGTSRRLRVTLPADAAPRNDEARVGKIASTCRSSVSVEILPGPENTLMPLSSKGLCEAEITSRHEVRAGVRYATAGVGTTPVSTTAAADRSDAPREVLARSRTLTHVCRGRPESGPGAGAATREPAPPRAVESSSTSRGGSPAMPRTPSVPNSFIGLRSSRSQGSRFQTSLVSGSRKAGAQRAPAQNDLTWRVPRERRQCPGGCTRTGTECRPATRSVRSIPACSRRLDPDPLARAAHEDRHRDGAIRPHATANLVAVTSTHRLAIHSWGAGRDFAR